MDDRLWILFIDSLRALALPPKDQVARFPNFVVTADELALEFDNWYRAARALNQLTAEHVQLLNAIDAKLASMSGQANERLWSEEALFSESCWADLRILATQALRAMGYEPGPAGPPPSVYIRGS
jgi:hypothetical protein